MQVHQLPLILLLILQCNYVSAFVPRIALTQQHRDQNPSSHHDQFGKRQHDPSKYHATATAAAAATPATTISRGCNARHISSTHSAAAGRFSPPSHLSSATTIINSKSAIPSSRGKKHEEKRGAITSQAGLLTRAEALTAATAAVAGLLFQPHQAEAAAETVAAEGVAPIEVEGVVVEDDAASSKGEAKYTVGSDEVGVLFGDGPIGIKLGDNPLKASGICRVYVTEVTGKTNHTSDRSPFR